MPPCAPPNSILSRVVPQDACFASLTSGMPYLAKKPFSLAMISGEESVSAINPRVAVVVSGASPAAAQAPPGTTARAAVSNAALPAVLRIVLRVLCVMISLRSILVGQLQPEDGLVGKAAKGHARALIAGVFHQHRSIGIHRQFQAGIPFAADAGAEIVGGEVVIGDDPGQAFHLD